VEIGSLNSMAPRESLMRPMEERFPQTPEPEVEDDFGEDEDAVETEFQGVRVDLEEASLAIGTAVDLAWMEFERERDAVAPSFAGRWTEREAIFANRQAAPKDSQGRLVKDHQNAHLHQGLSMGLLTEAVTTVGPAIQHAVIGADGLPVEFFAYGYRGEDGPKKQLVEGIAEYDAERAGWRAAVGAGLLRPLPMHGTVTFRQGWQETTELTYEAGKIVERPRPGGMFFYHWPELDVVVSDPQAEHAWEQRTVIWRDQVTVSELWGNRRRLDSEDTIIRTVNGPVAKPESVRRGRYTNLEALMVEESELAQSTYMPHQHTGSDEAKGLRGEGMHGLRTERLRKRLELQGKFPVGSMLRTGELPLRAFKALIPEPIGIDTDRTTGEVIPIEGEELFRLCDQVVWYVTVVEGDNGWHVIDLRPCPYRRGRTELLHATFIASGCFYGHGIDQMAGDLSDTADMFFNDVSRILKNNARPPIVVDQKLAGHFRDGELWKLEGDGEIFKFDSSSVPSGLAAKDAVGYLLKPWDPSIVNFVSMIQGLFNTRAMATQVGKGAAADTGTDTAAEISMQQASLDRRLRAVVDSIAKVNLVTRSWSLWLEDLDTFNTDAQLTDLAMRVAGQPGAGAKSIWPKGAKTLSLADEFSVRHIGDGAVRREVTAQMTLKLASTFGAVIGPEASRRLFRIGIESLGMDPDRILPEDRESVDPMDEYNLIISGGARPTVSPKDDDASHVKAHTMQALRVQEMIASGQVVEGIDLLAVYDMLQSHILEHVQAFNEKYAEMEARKQAEAGGGGPPGASGGKKAIDKEMAGGGDRAPAADGDKSAKGMAAAAAQEGGVT